MEKLSGLLPPGGSAPASEPPAREPKCPICNDAGFVHPRDSEGKPVYSEVVPCRCRRTQIKADKEHWLWQHCNLPPNSERMTLENFERRTPAAQAAFEAAERMAAGSRVPDFHGWLTMGGLVDQGKTHLAIAVARTWLLNGRPARYIHVPLMLDELRAEIGKPDLSYEKMSLFFLQVPLLVLDDLGTEKLTEWAQERLETIIDHRYVNQFPTIITTNRPLSELTPRICSRIQRYEPSDIVALEDEEYRLYKQRGQGVAK